MMLQAVVHDVKNKLAELALRLADSNPEAAALALASADKLTQALLIDEPGRITPRIDAAYPADMLEEMAAEYGPLFPGKTLRVDLSRAPPLWYYDVRLVRLAFSNAVHNALKHCTDEVSLGVCQEADYLVFEARDDGKGFPASILERNWEDGSPGGTTARRGTGLGLLVTRRIVQAHVLERSGAKRSGWMALANEGGAVARLALP
jgi:two-component system sensor histidine kinase RstB